MADPPLISLRFGRIRFGEEPLFDEVELRLGRGERACLVGRNGSGKWPAYFEDSLPAVVDIGPGSPVGVAFGTGAK